MKYHHNVLHAAVGIVTLAGGLAIVQAQGAGTTSGGSQQRPDGTQSQTPGTTTGSTSQGTTSGSGTAGSGQTMTLTGCIGGTGTSSSPYMLSNIESSSGSSSATGSRSTGTTGS